MRRQKNALARHVSTSVNKAVIFAPLSSIRKADYNDPRLLPPTSFSRARAQAVDERGTVLVDSPWYIIVLNGDGRRLMTLGLQNNGMGMAAAIMIASSA